MPDTDPRPGTERGSGAQRRPEAQPRPDVGEPITPGRDRLRAGRLVVRVDFSTPEIQETGQGRLGRRVPRVRPDSGAYAFLARSIKFRQVGRAS